MILSRRPSTSSGKVQKICVAGGAVSERQRHRGFFAKLTKRRLQRGVFRSIIELQAAINRFIEEADHDPKPFVWTADPDKIIAAVKRGHQA